MHVLGPQDWLLSASILLQKACMPYAFHQIVQSRALKREEYHVRNAEPGWPENVQDDWQHIGFV
jgi:hypothetical protein